MTKFKIIAAAITLGLSTGASAVTRDCCRDMACCHEDADCCDHAKGKADGHAVDGNAKAG